MSSDVQLPARRQREPLAEDPSLQEYKRCADRYMRTCPSQHTFLILRRICMDEAIPAELRQLPLLQYMSNTCKEFVLNDIELAMVGYILTSLVTKTNTSFSLDLLRFVAYRAKVLMNHKASIILNYLHSTDPAFEEKYFKWLQIHEASLTVSPRRLVQVGLLQRPS